MRLRIGRLQNFNRRFLWDNSGNLTLQGVLHARVLFQCHTDMRIANLADIHGLGSASRNLPLVQVPERVAAKLVSSLRNAFVGGGDASR